MSSSGVSAPQVDVPRPNRDTRKPLAPTIRCLTSIQTSSTVVQVSYLNTLAAADVASTDMSWAQVIVLSIVQGLTEFLPISSSGHIRIMSELFWGHDAGASFTAVIQLGTEIAVLVFFQYCCGLGAWPVQ